MQNQGARLRITARYLAKPRCINLVVTSRMLSYSRICIYHCKAVFD